MKRRTRTPVARKKKKNRKKARKPAVMRWNPDPDDVQRSVIKLVLTLVELIRKLMERQAIRRMDERTLTAAETEAVGKALMEIERTIRDIGTQFDLAPEDLNLDLGTIKLL
jgi:Gas vesicle protein K